MAPAASDPPARSSPAPEEGSTGGVVPPRYGNVLFALLLSAFNTMIISGIATLRGLGLSDQVPSRWLGAFLVAWPIAFPVLLVVAPAVRRILARLGDRLPARAVPLVFAALLSGFMTLIISGIATARVLGFSGTFVLSWSNAFLTAWPVMFPIVLVVAPVVRRLVAALVVHPVAPGPKATSS